MDFTDTQKIEQRVRETANALHAMVDDVAEAKQIEDFASERRKITLAKFAAPLLERGAAAAETLARANPDYQKEIQGQRDEFRAARKVIETQAAIRVKHEASRSLLSYGKEMLRNIPE